MSFNPTNVMQASMYQTIQLRLTSNPLKGDPPIVNNDEVYLFIDPGSDPATQCQYDLEGQPQGVKHFKVTDADSEGYLGYVELPILSNMFSEGSSYVLCYLSRGLKTAIVLRRPSDSSGSTALLIWPPLYNQYNLFPPSASGGEGMVDLSLSENELPKERPHNKAFHKSFTIFIPSCVPGWNCTDLNALTIACDAVGKDLEERGSVDGVVLVSYLSYSSVSSVAGKLVVPYFPSQDGYFICVPYCPGGAVNCGTASVSMSYTVVAAATPILKFSPATPGVYSRIPEKPQAREEGSLTFYGIGLSNADKVKIIVPNDQCTSPSASLLDSIRFGALEYTPKEKKAFIRFVRLDLLDKSITGRVCYWRSASGMWSSAYLSKDNQKADFTIDPLQPSHFTVLTPSPGVGKTIRLKFFGNGLNGNTDKAFLSSVSISKPCEAILDDEDLFICDMTGTATPVCNVYVNPPLNIEIKLFVYYCTDGRANYAQLHDTVTLAARNPTYTLSSYPIFGGQFVRIQFTGKGLSANDEIRIIPHDKSCGNDVPPFTNASLTSFTEVKPGETYECELVGQADVCLTVCYHLSSSDSWVTTHSSVGSSVSVFTSCPATALYIAPYPGRYNFPMTTRASPITVYETAQMRIENMYSSNSIIPVGIKIVRMPDACVLKLCSGKPACAEEASADDFVSEFALASLSANVMLSDVDSNYVVCVLLVKGESYIPVLPYWVPKASVNATTYGFKATTRNLELSYYEPKSWHVGMATLTTIFSGVGLDALRDRVYPVASITLLDNHVCPPPDGVLPMVLVPSVHPENSTTKVVTVTYARSDLLTIDVVHFCYQWASVADTGSRKGQSRMSYAGYVHIDPAIPSSFKLVNMPADGEYYATDSVTMIFFSDDSKNNVLSADNDAVYFYRFDSSMYPNPNCYCNPFACPSELKISYNDAIFTNVTTAQVVPGSQVNYTNFHGFRNYEVDTTYVVCYSVGFFAHADMYLGRFMVKLANPMYYTLLKRDGAVNHAGEVISILAHRCRDTSRCKLLTEDDQMILIPSAVECASVYSADAFASVVQHIGRPVVSGANEYMYLQRFVVNHAGKYRVCYRRHSKLEGSFAELAFTSKFLAQPVEVSSEDPASFETVPASPSEGQFLIVNLQCSQVECSSCRVLRLIQGADASCWDSSTKSQVYSSTDCLTTRSIQFPNQYIAEGSYTVCYGDGDMETTRRLPGALVISKMNPSSYASVPDAGRTIFTNQVSNFILSIRGEGLGVNDEAFLLTAKFYSCHDLRTSDIQNNRTLQRWLAPSIYPYTLQETSDGVSWIVSNLSKRFGVGMLYDRTLCDKAGGPCEMKLCYKRSGTSWAPVAIESLPSIQIRLPDPSSVSFDRSILISNMYVMVTVSGSNLKEKDRLAINTGIVCDAGAVTAAVLVGKPSVDENGTQWRGVLRLLDGGANTYTVCYTRESGTTSEINNIKFPGSSSSNINILPSPLYAVYSKQNFTSLHYAITRYEEMIIAGSFKDDGSEIVPLTNAQLIHADSARAECNYDSFPKGIKQAAPFPVIENFTETTPGSGVFQGRLMIEQDVYMLCMNTSKGLFRVDGFPPNEPAKASTAVSRSAALREHMSAPKDTIAIGNEIPNNYDVFPNEPMVGQQVQFNFYAPLTPSTTRKPFAVGDAVQIIDGNLFDCGFRNTTIFSEGLVKSIMSTNDRFTALAELILPDVLTNSAGLRLANKPHSLTVCYRKQSGTFATVPRPSTTVDRNLHVKETIPVQWYSNPMQLQDGASASISFVGNNDYPEYLSAEDSAFLVRAHDTNKLSTNSEFCRTGTPVLSSIVIQKDGINTVWHITSGKLEEGNYVVCYIAARNGKPLYVHSPELLVVYPLQSPTGAYSNHHSQSDDLNAYRGERFYIFFKTSEELQVVLDDGLTPASKLVGRDVVRISPHRNCSAPLQSDRVAAIPSSFGYKPLDTIMTNLGVPVPYIHLRVRAESGTYFVCMQRTGREPWQAYYTSSLVGSDVHPAVLTITNSPVTQFTTTPVSPRVLVKRTKVHFSFSSEYTLNNFKQFFFVPFEKNLISTEDEISHDNCYRPPTRSEAASETVVLLNNSLQVNFETMDLDWSFTDAGTYLLCFQLVNQSTVASVFPSTLTVLNPSPIFYEVKPIISKGIAFSMSIAALDPIFDHDKNRMDIYVLPSDADIEALPSCVGANPPSGGGVTSFTNFKNARSSYASVEPIINDSGYFFVCFLTYDQSMAFPVPNHAGYFSFSVGITGAQKYEVHPPNPYLGQILNINIKGNLLSDKDHVKIVRVFPKELAALAYSLEDTVGSSYEVECSASSINADANAPPGDTEGSAVVSSSSIVGFYYPRVNATGKYVLCYQSFPLNNVWSLVDNPGLFTVGEAHPSGYLLQPDPMYKTQIVKLIVQDSVGLLQAQDRLKLVSSSDSDSPRFKCNDNAPSSSDVVVIEFVASESTKDASVYRVCGRSSISVVVCYQLAGTNSWAEVPRLSPPPNYVFSPIIFLKDPFVGPSLIPNQDYTPRPYEPFSFTFTSLSASEEVTHVGFSLGSLEPCTPNVVYVTPSYYNKKSSTSNVFTVALNAASSYTLHLGMSGNVLDPNITKTSSLVVGPCEPCGVVPPYAFLDQEVSLTFTSSDKGLSEGDALRLIPRSQDLSDLPCENPQGPYKSTTFSPTSVVSDGSSTSFTVYTGKPEDFSSYLGEYHLCYRKGNSGPVKGNFAIISDDAGLKAIFSIYPIDFVRLRDVCPNGDNVYALETVVFNLTVLDEHKYPHAAFGPKDKFQLVPLADASNILCEDVNSISTQPDAGDPGVVLPRMDSYGTAYSNWYATMPAIQHSTSYLLCFKLEYDTTFRSVSTTKLTVQSANPYTIYTTPSVILPESINATINVVGIGMLATDNTYLVSNSESCAETCYLSLQPTEWDGGPKRVTFTKEYINSTLLRITFSGPIQDVVTLGVCYRRAGYLLTRVGNVHVGEPNPTLWVTNFVPRIGTRPTITFSGKDLTKEDRVMIVRLGDTCYEGAAVANAVFLSVDSLTHLTTSFYLTLIDVVVEKYTICYFVSTVGSYVEMKEPFSVLPGGPNVFTTSNTLMQWRATVVSVKPDSNTNPYTPQVNDEAYITNEKQSCFDEVHATVPYGTPYAKLTNPLEPLRIRVGFNTDGTYIVCYKLADSGYARVGSNLILKPVLSSPTTVVRFPILTYQGQRLAYNFTGYTENDPIEERDEVMLVERARGCWDTPDMDPDRILVSSSPLVRIQKDQKSLGEWRAHVPSLGPDVPKGLKFPCEYILCYRAGSQEEYIPVPTPVGLLLQPSDAESVAVTDTENVLYAADPPTYSTQPATVRVGMSDVRVSFPRAQVGDMAYAVWFEILTNEVCTSESTLISSEASAYPKYGLSLPGNLRAGDNHVALCYIKTGGSVAEVPQTLSISTGNPSSYKMNTVTPLAGFEREYIAFTIFGEGLNAQKDAVVFSEVSCGTAPKPLKSTPALARMGEMETIPTGVKFVAQFRSSRVALRVYLCYELDSIWREVGSPFLLQISNLSTAQLETFNGNGSPRAGQHLSITLASSVLITLDEAAVLAVSTPTGSGTWCHNFTQDDIQEPDLIMSAPLLEVPVWQYTGASRLCLKVSKDAPWMDIASTVDGIGLTEVLEANPSRMEVFPNPPRVGQQVTLTFHLVVPSAKGDMIRIPSPGYRKSCDTATSVVGFLNAIPVMIVDGSTTRVTLEDSTDALAYRSFNTTGTYLVCYYSALEAAWGVVGGTFQAGTINVQNQVPQRWELESGALVQFQSFTLRFEDEFGRLNASGGDLAWAAPSGQSCGVDPHSCAQCILFDMNADVSTSKSVVTKPMASNIVDNFNVCYRLAGSTASMMENPIEINAGPIQCIKNTTMTAGMRQVVTFMIGNGVDVEQDTWGVSFYQTSMRECQSHYVPSFLPEMVKRGTTTATTVSYIVNWPLDLVEDRYRICYHHNNMFTPVCTCEQINSKNGECYITMQTSIEKFTVAPDPSYVGQTIGLTLTLATDRAMYPPTNVKFVRYVDRLTSCDEAATFDPQGVLRKVKDTVYQYVFKHDYTLDPGGFLVCVLTSLSTDYVRIASNSKDKHHDNLLWIRPYFKLATFPSKSEYLRAMQTLDLRFTHQSKLPDDVVSLGDSFTFVSDPKYCTNEYINHQDPSKELKKFYLDDTAFRSIPAPVRSTDSQKFESGTFLTFNEGGVGTQYLCYRLVTGTWAPVLPALSIQPAMTKASECVMMLDSEQEKGDVADSSARAMQFIRTTIKGTADFAKLYTKFDAIRIVPQDYACINDTAVVFLSSETYPQPSTNFDVSVVTFTEEPGVYKVCYRIGGPASDFASWSPICQDITFSTPSPTANFSGCLIEGQSLDVTTTHRDGFTFDADDRVRYVAGGELCLHADGSSARPLSTITLNDVAQAVDGFRLGPDAMGKTSVSLPYALLGSQTNSFTLCYRDAGGHEFAIPINHAIKPRAWIFPLQEQQPSFILVNPSNAQLGQRIVLNFTASSDATTPGLTPYGLLPEFPVPGPAFNGTFDAATLLLLEDGVAYREGRCAAAARDNVLELYGVYGANSKPPYTVAVYDAKIGGKRYIACYCLASCRAVDIGRVLNILPYNPARTYTTPSKPRQGQVIEVHFTRDSTTPDSAFLTPSQDLATIQTSLESCWSLGTDAGTVVLGTPSEVYFTAIFPAQAPAQSRTLITRICYRLIKGTWSEVPGGEASVLPANPSAFEIDPEIPRQSKLNTIRFIGSGLSLGDHVKIIPLSVSCNDTSRPPADFVAYDTALKPLNGTKSGWQVTAISMDSTMTGLNISTDTQGEYSVCYRLKDDTVWTLMHGSLHIYMRNPSMMTQTPVMTLEGEMFTLNFTNTLSDIIKPFRAVSVSPNAKDRVAVYFGEKVSCIAPDGTSIIETGPSRIDLLTQSIAFQLVITNRGSYTVCYLDFLGSSSLAEVDKYSPTWGFAPIVVGPNPKGVALFPPVDAPVADYNPQKLISLVFSGFGLSSLSDNLDEVRLVDASLPYSHESCFNHITPTELHLYKLIANGSHAVQVLSWIKPKKLDTLNADATPSSRYWICYKLYGGLYHIVGSTLLKVFGTASPSAANPSKPTSDIAIGEAVNWTLLENRACARGDVLYYSASGCNDRPYYDMPPLASGQDLLSLFPWGASWVDCSVPQTSVRVSYTAGSPTNEDPYALHTAEAQGYPKLSLCYYHNASHQGFISSVTILGLDTISINDGVPPVLPHPLTGIQAGRIFSFELDVQPESDFLVLTATAEKCSDMGTPPEDAALFMTMTYNKTQHRLVVTTAVPAAGTYYICYSHRIKECELRYGRDCARVVGEIRATAANPVGWKADSAPVYTSMFLNIMLVSDKALPQEGASLWMRQLPDGASHRNGAPTMADVAARCLESHTGDSGGGPAQVTFTFKRETGKWKSTEPIKYAGPYALCYKDVPIDEMDNISALVESSSFSFPRNVPTIAIFYPVTNAGPVVKPSRVSNVVFKKPPVVGGDTVSHVLLIGSGLSQDDIVVAVGVPFYSLLSTSDTLKIPLDICTNTRYTPRVPGISVLSNTVYDPSSMSQMLYAFTFQITGGYMLCYTSADARRVQQHGIPITPDGFAVAPTVTRVTVIGGVGLVKVPMDLLINGNGLRDTDLAALALIPSHPKARHIVTLDIPNVCDSDKLIFTTPVSANKDGKTATYRFTPSVEGDHVVCYKVQPGGGILAGPQELPGVIAVGVDSAVEAVFIIQPDLCQTFLACKVQPKVELQDKKGEPVASPGANVQMALAFAETGKLTPESYLLGGGIFINEKNTSFNFVALSISTKGKYYMTAEFTLMGNHSLRVNSLPFTVEDSHVDVRSIAVVVCLPFGINPDRESPIHCTCESLSSFFIPKNYSISVSAGTATACIASGKTPKGLSYCTFNVTPPQNTGGAGMPVNYLVVEVRNIEPYIRWPVSNSPIVVRLPSIPDQCTTLSCTKSLSMTDHMQLPTDYVRAGDTLNCTVQGCAVVDNITTNVVVPVSNLRVTHTYFSDGMIKTDPIDIGAFPGDPNGLYSFSFTVGSALKISVNGSILPSSSYEGHDVSESSVTMTGSPQVRTILGVPTARDSRISCKSNTSSSREWFLPSEAMNCVVQLADHSGRVNGIGTDLEVLMPQGGTATTINPTIASTELTIAVTAPESTPTQIASMLDESKLHGTITRHSAFSLISAYDFRFEIQVNFRPAKGMTLGSYTGKLVYVRAMTDPLPEFIAGARASIDLVGSGLLTTHSYEIAGTSTCDPGSSGLQKATASVVSSPTQATRLSFTVPKGMTFYLCVGTQDLPDYLRLLTPHAFIISGGQHSDWTRDGLILLIIGIIFLVILLLLLVVLLYCIFCVNRGFVGRHRYAREVCPRSTVYIPPMANDRFLWRENSIPVLLTTSQSNTEGVNHAHTAAAAPSDDPPNILVTTERTMKDHHRQKNMDPTLPLPSPVSILAQDMLKHHTPYTATATTNSTSSNTMLRSKDDVLEAVGDAVKYRARSKKHDSQSRNHSEGSKRKNRDHVDKHGRTSSNIRRTITPDIYPSPQPDIKLGGNQLTSSRSPEPKNRILSAPDDPMTLRHTSSQEKRLINLGQTEDHNIRRKSQSSNTPIIPLPESAGKLTPGGPVVADKQQHDKGHDTVGAMLEPFVVSGHTSRPMINPHGDQKRIKEGKKI
ncbi:unnamed protein product [Phytomonas sp. EM1]|nr:unnamed protein product [Phytomonas sp. EM1]|eukprot:CCW65226.1 unnamed protein product [Phytomonas sp. isolate EM1]